MKRALVTLALALVACGGGEMPDDDNRSTTDVGGWASLDYEEVTLPTGRVIPCVIFESVNKGGISCDWSQK